MGSKAQEEQAMSENSIPFSGGVVSPRGLLSQWLERVCIVFPIHSVSLFLILHSFTGPPWIGSGFAWSERGEYAAGPGMAFIALPRKWSGDNRRKVRGQCKTGIIGMHAILSSCRGGPPSL